VELACSVSSVGVQPLPDALGLIAEAGYSAVELHWQQVQRQFPNPVTAGPLMAELLRDRRLKLCSLNAGTITAERDDQCQLQVRRLCECLPLAKQLAVPAINLTGGPRTLENFNALRQALPRLAEEAAKLGLSVNVANEMDTRVENGNDLAAVFTGGLPDNVGIVLDMGQFHLASVNPADMIRQMQEWIRVVRIGDLMGTMEVQLGQGEVEIAALISTLRTHKYDGPIVYRTSLYDEEQPDRYIKHALRHLQPLLA